MNECGKDKMAKVGERFESENESERHPQRSRDYRTDLEVDRRGPSGQQSIRPRLHPELSSLTTAAVVETNAAWLVGCGLV
ncbi:hypothetical protein MPTK1_3g01660 [Marchantia polymorpha subsp. ruderalis]|uniref:Uncharacterized protein n=2 Tax=Marchantia polymorpha TaxID=3197 RepID=A0AAF6AWE0_MARPO|nr:hypothetical protein MARPO_0007s0158 [Marchantia polymorpha]BBN04074.1 hypothetical protein Mp_3g01660 [Marchantia polymorpha subsp. ruderalis]|eukprot:PTQ47761.1 hypothetical protein MARPO_0007s0158 [Marchantia polymorpha]